MRAFSMKSSSETTLRPVLLPLLVPNSSSLSYFIIYNESKDEESDVSKATFTCHDLVSSVLYFVHLLFIPCHDSSHVPIEAPTINFLLYTQTSVCSSKGSSKGSDKRSVWSMECSRTLRAFSNLACLFLSRSIFASWASKFWPPYGSLCFAFTQTASCFLYSNLNDGGVRF